MSVVGDARDTIESDIKRLLDDLLQCVPTAHARTVLRDAVWCIEDRACARTDLNSRDLYVEQRVRDVLGELSKPNASIQSLEIAVEFVEALLVIDYTERYNKFTRLCRSMFVILQCGNENIVKYAQRVFVKMIELDAAAHQREPNSSALLKDFLPKELKDMCDTVAREADGRSTPSRNKSLAVMAASEALMRGHPRYVNPQLRLSLLNLSVVLCGMQDVSVRCAAYDCLLATLGSTGGLKTSDAPIETRKLADDCAKSLRASHNTEFQTTSALLALRALIVSRGVASLDKQLFNSFCTLILEHHKIARSPLVKSAVCCLIPIVARSDGTFSTRKLAYSTILMDPLKNIRDEGNKTAELHNMAEYIRNSGYDALDATMKLNLESVVQRYVSRPPTQLECWNILAAIAKHFQGATNAPTQLTRSNATLASPTSSLSPGAGSSASASLKFCEMLKRCLPSLKRSPVSTVLLEYLDQIKQHIPSVGFDVSSAQHELIDVVLRRAAQLESTGAASATPISMSSNSGYFGSPAVLVAQPQGGGGTSGQVSGATGTSGTSPNSGTPGGASTSSASAFGLHRLVSYFNRNASNQGGAAGADEQQSINVSADEIEVALVALSKRPVEDYQNLVEELRVNILALQRHPSSHVRKQCSQTILSCVELACGAAGMQQRISQESASHFFSRVEELLESYLKNSVMELEPQCRMAMVEAFCGTPSVMQLINRPKILNTVMSFLNDTSRIREVVVRSLVETCQALKEDGVDVSEVERQLKVTVETSVVTLEYSTETRLLLRHLADLAIFTRFGIDPVLSLMGRTFVALNRKLKRVDSELDIVVLGILKTLKYLIGPLVSNDSVAQRFSDEVSELQSTILTLLLGSTTAVITQEAIKVLVALNNVVPIVLKVTPSEAMKTLDCLTAAFLDNKLMPREDLVAILTFFGQVGAVKPTKVVVQRDEEKLASDADLVITFDYSVIVYRALSRMLETSVSEPICCRGMTVLLQLLHASNKEEIGGVHAIKAVLNLIKRCETASLRVEALINLAALINERHQNTLAFMLPEIVVLLDQLWLTSDTGQFYVLLGVVAALKPGTLSVEDQQDMWPWLYPRLIDAALRDSTPNRQVALMIIDIIMMNAKSVPSHCIPFITSALTSFIQQSDQPTDVRGAAIIAVIEVVNSLDLIQHVTPLLHALRTLYRHLELSRNAMNLRFPVAVRDALRKFLKKFPSSRPIVLGIIDLMESHRGNESPQYSEDGDATVLPSMPGEHRSLSSSVSSSRNILDGSGPTLRQAVDVRIDPVAAAVVGEPNDADVTNLHKQVERGLRITDPSKWKEWLVELQRLVVLSSPHFAFRLIVDLFEKHELLRRELFFASFKCLYESLSGEHVSRFNQALVQAVSSSDGEVSAKCLALADYLDHNRPVAADVRNALNSSLNNPDSPLFLPPPQSHRLTPTKTMPRVYRATDGLDDPEFFRSATSMRRHPAIAPGRSLGGHSLLQGSMVFPQTPQSNLNAPGIAPPRRGRLAAPIAPRHGAVADMSVWQDQEIPTLTPGGRATSIPSVPGNVKSVVILPGESPLVPAKVMVEAAQANGMYDKAIRFLEMKLGPYLGPSMVCGRPWRALPKDALDNVVLPLAQLYSSLGMQHSVVGLFESIHYLDSQEAKGIGFELLRWWSEARSAYSVALSGSGNPINNSVSGSGAAGLVRPMQVTEQEREGYVRTLCLCGDWKSALAVARDMMRESPSNASSSTIPISGATAAWILNEWDDVSRFAQRITQEPLQYFFVNGVVFHRSDAQNGNDQMVCIRDARLSVESSLKTLLPVSYTHAYDNITMLQNFQEIWEAVAFRRAKTNERRSEIKAMWAARFSAMKSDNWFQKLRCLMVHSLVLSPTEMADTWLQFCESVRSTYPHLSNWAMRSLQTDRLASKASDDVPPLEVIEQNAPFVRVGYFKHLWNTGKRNEAVVGMQHLVAAGGRRLQEDDPRSFGTGHLKLGLWKQELHADNFWKSELRDVIIDHLHSAIRSCPDDYDTWHAWALMNYRIQQRESDLDRGTQSTFVSKAHEGFVAAICLSPSASNALQDVMRLLQLWIVYEGVVTLKESIADAIQRISVEHWIQVVPQLIAHMGHSLHDVRDVVFRILQKISCTHPQVVVFPLLVNSLEDPNAVPTLEVNIRDTLSKTLLDSFVPKRIRGDAELAAKLLCSAASLPVEHILEHMTQVAEAWATRDLNNNSTSSSSTGGATNKQPVEDDSHTFRRLGTVILIYKRNPSLGKLGDIGKYVQMVINDYRAGRREAARSILEQLIEEITEYLKKLRKGGEDAQRAMEPLATLRNLSVCMFGEYNWTNPSQVPTIASFSAQCDVIRSKKRPRKIRVTGSNGSVYAFLLKSNEDIRLDERVMQLFGLINSFLDPQHHSPSCMINKFPVIPISANVGLLGWVEYSDTMHDVISNYRTLSGVDGFLERTLLADQFEEPFEDLVERSWNSMQHVRRAEAFEVVFNAQNCESADLARSMWQRSPSAEVWLERRTAFTESLATMSMVGYILGLGDRHLGNIMLSMSTGRIVHIDFGDSFDVCRVRTSLPETVPFRLTRMLIHAMEVFGVDGVFRSTCVSILTMLHQHRDSIIALLSAFIYDPIVSHQESMRSMLERQTSPQQIVERIRNKLRGLELGVPEDQFIPFDVSPCVVAASASIARPDFRFISNAFNDAAKREVSAALTPRDQVQMLIGEATSVENLAAMYHGWAPLW